MQTVFVLLIAVPFLFDTSIATYQAYVTAAGSSNSVCSQSTPCGHFQQALDIATNEDLVISISGVNPSYSSDVAYCHVQISGNVTFIFDTTMIATMDDWFASASSCAYMYYCSDVMGFDDLYYCDYPLAILANANVKFYGLRWDTANVFRTEYGPTPGSLMASWSNSTFYCEDCIFRGGGAMELRSKTVDFHN
eukprot:142658_1